MMKKPSLTKRNEVFNQQAYADVVFSRYDLSKRSVGSYRMGCLYPIYCRNDIHPGDKFSISAAPFLRFLPLVSPAFMSCDIELRYFFVPYRLLWNNWKPFISPNTADQVNLLEPYIPNITPGSKSTALWWNIPGTIYDYMGLACVRSDFQPLVSAGQNAVATAYDNNDPLYQTYGFSSWYYESAGAMSPTPSPLKYSAYPFLAYNMIWNEYFRDENLDDYAPYTVDDGYLERAPHDFFIRRVNWEKDYFSSATPFVTQSVFGSAPTISSGDTIEDLREASALTRWLELQVVGGHRYQESILTHFGVRVPDEAAQIPVYLGGCKVPVSIDSIEQNSNPSAEDFVDTPLGTLAGRGTGSGGSFIDNVQFKEHGVVLGLMYVRPKAVYCDVNPRDLLRKSSRHDYLWPTFVNLGDEAVMADEVTGGAIHQTGDFGYQTRYQSMRTSFDSVHGQLIPGEPLESWTIARRWISYTGGIPVFQAINRDFISCLPSNRVFADTEDVDNIVCDVTTFVDATRPLPSYVNPKID